MPRCFGGGPLGGGGLSALLLPRLLLLLLLFLLLLLLLLLFLFLFLFLFLSSPFTGGGGSDGGLYLGLD